MLEKLTRPSGVEMPWIVTSTYHHLNTKPVSTSKKNARKLGLKEARNIKTRYAKVVITTFIRDSIFKC